MRKSDSFLSWILVLKCQRIAKNSEFKGKVDKTSFFPVNYKARGGDLTGFFYHWTKEYYHDKRRIGNIFGNSLKSFGMDSVCIWDRMEKNWPVWNYYRCYGLGNQTASKMITVFASCSNMCNICSFPFQVSFGGLLGEKASLIGMQHHFYLP